MGLRAQFEGLVNLKKRFGQQANFYFVYGKEAFPNESEWPAPVPDAKPVLATTTVQERCRVAERFLKNISNELTVLIDSNTPSTSQTKSS